MPETFGARLRRRREERGFDLIAVAEKTKIKPSLLEALERDDVSQWPSGFYRRAFIRTYALAIDLDPDVVFREFLEVHPEPPEIDVVAAMASTLGLGDRHPRPATTRVRNAVGLALGSLSRLRRSDVELPPAPRAPMVSAGVDALIPPRMPSVSDTPHHVPAAPSVSDTSHVAAPSAPAMKTAPSAPVADNIPSPPTVPANPVSEAIDESTLEPVAAAPPPSSEADLLAIAQLSSEFARVGSAHEVQPLLQQAAKVLNATGLIVWLWDPSAGALKPALVHGYSPRTIAQLPPVRRDADNATALGFRTAQMCTIAGSEHVSGALVVPMLTAVGCVGVLAVELQRQSEQTPSLRAQGTILAALLAQMAMLTGVAAGGQVAVGQ